jgi:putative Holliday junction resolvase
MAALIFTALDMRDALPDGGGLIGLDLGTQTIGTAFADPTGASPRPARPSRGKFSSTRCHRGADRRAPSRASSSACR